MYSSCTFKLERQSIKTIWMSTIKTHHDMMTVLKVSNFIVNLFVNLRHAKIRNSPKHLHSKNANKFDGKRVLKKTAIQACECDKKT